MEYTLDKALQEMSLENEKPIVLKNLPKYSSAERNGCSIIGKLLCPENQKMTGVIHEMPRLWRVYNRARGIALPEDKFQFIFDSESDMLTVLEAGAWTFNDWSMTLECWVENPSEDYLRILPIWIRLRHIPVNFNTAETIREIAEHIGQVTHVAFDPLRPQSRGFVRVRVLFDVNKPLKNTRNVELPTGEVVAIGIEYERIRKRCYQCLRLTHDKEHCPLNPSNRQAIATGRIKLASIIPSRLIPKISKDDPLFGVLTDDDVGIDTISENDPQGQKTLLRLEAPPLFTTDVDTGKGLVFDFERAKSSKPTQESSSNSETTAGHGRKWLARVTQSSSEAYATAPNQWRRKAQALLKEGSATSATMQEKSGEDVVLMKHKASEEVVVEEVVVSKIAKRDDEKVVPNEELPHQKSRERWLKEGDMNTKFFHGSVQRRRVQNCILSLFDNNDVEQFAEGSKGEIAVEYFRKMFSSSKPDCITEALEGMRPRVTPSMNVELTRPVTVAEIKAAAFSIRGESTPGADGMSGFFYQAYWDIVGPQVITEIEDLPANNRLRHARSVSYSVIVNGASYGFTKPERGIRQGDPLSPFLFILCAEALVHIMHKAEHEGRLTGHSLTDSCPSIQHLLFADESLFVCVATFKECTEFLNCLRIYGRASGQEINFQKSAITFGKKLDPYMKRLIGLFTGIEQEGGTGKYLGLPECFSGSKREILGFITDRLKQRLSGWYEETMSLGGKEVLLKFVALALPVYAMSCFRLTKHQCQKITSAMSDFWWNGSENKQKMHWVSWEKICKSKAQGCLGFRDIGSFNQALLAKQAWRLLDVPNSLLARVYKARYYSQKTLLEATAGYRPSYAWQSIVFGKELLERGLMKAISNGQSTNIWIDKWLFDEIPRRPMNKESPMDISLKVSSLIILQASVWQLTALPQPDQGFTDSIEGNIHYILSLMEKVSLPANMRAAIPWLLWRIWKARNSSLYAGKDNDPNILIAAALEEAEEWHQQNLVIAQENKLWNHTKTRIENRWIKPAWGCLKCNVYASWTKESLHCGGAWLLRNHTGDVVLHARDAFVPVVNRIAAELHCILWCFQSLHNVRVHSCEIWSDCNAAVCALELPNDWPKYRSLLNKISQVIQVMRDVKFKISSPKANTLARDIACSVTREGRFNSYLAAGGPAWLHERIEEERRRRN
ncbi:Reverse transcriptase domain [Arabidopsis thaliana x Arabidopsis arenosa]|uniref:Reverse transcriptase domain n=1 Tax=Arabidopsis thaliana x Arabidopsis arenosa TaxID=1240361 RepID=A0A8T1Y9P8_9BRAS|nr:Reverse transcriptase domain [Arabidopsis thaliana x Arabidopsis arenosa]